MAYLEEKNIIYYFRVKGFASVKNAVFDDICDKNIDFQAYTEDHPYMDEIQYTISQSNQARRVVYKIYGSMDKKQQELLLTIYCHLYFLGGLVHYFLLNWFIVMLMPARQKLFIISPAVSNLSSIVFQSSSVKCPST